MLNQSDLEQFQELGFLKVSDCMPETITHQSREAIWTDMKERYSVTDDGNTWHGQYFNFPAKVLKGWEMPCEPMSQILDALLGHGYWVSDHQRRSCGVVFASLPRSGENSAWTLSGEWHWDFPENRNSPSYTSVLMCTLLTDAEHRDGGTLFVSGSHHLVAEHFHRTRGRFSHNYSAKRMQSFFKTEKWFRDLDLGTVPKNDRVAAYMEKSSTFNGRQLRVHELTGNSGDVYFLHPLLVHAGAPNGGNSPRLMLGSSAWRDPDAA